MKLSGTYLIQQIEKLNKFIPYEYVNPSTTARIAVSHIESSEGPIYIKQWDPGKNQTIKNAGEESISVEMLKRIAVTFVPGRPVHVDRVLGASYNTRSALEALLVNTPEFYVCYPYRIDPYSGEIKRTHQHVIWLPSQKHNVGEIGYYETDMIVSEITIETSQSGLQLPQTFDATELDIDVATQHAKIQIALILIGEQLGFSTWVAHNDQGIIFEGNNLLGMGPVIFNLNQQPLMGLNGAARAASLIDCIWFTSDKRKMPAVMEIAHSTGVTSGLTRMDDLYYEIPAIMTRYVIVGPDEIRQKVLNEAYQKQFLHLNTRFLPYSAVEELLYLCTNRKIKGVSEEFLDSFMEIIVE